MISRNHPAGRRWHDAVSPTCSLRVSYNASRRRAALTAIERGYPASATATAAASLPATTTDQPTDRQICRSRVGPGASETAPTWPAHSALHHRLGADAERGEGPVRRSSRSSRPASRPLLHVLFAVAAAKKPRRERGSRAAAWRRGVGDPASRQCHWPVSQMQKQRTGDGNVVM